MTPLKFVYDRFFDIVTDDLYEELCEEKSYEDCKGLLLSSIPMFEFPTHPFSFTVVESLGEKVEYFEQDLTLEECNILAMGMAQIWTQRQTTSIEMTRQKYSGTDFKMTSQASQLQRLIALLTHVKDEHRRLQMLHSRRGVEDGQYVSNFGMFVEPMRQVNRYPTRRKRDKGANRKWNNDSILPPKHGITIEPV